MVVRPGAAATGIAPSPMRALGVDRRPRGAHTTLGAGWLGDRWRRGDTRLEESPGSTGIRCRSTTGGGQTPGKVPQRADRHGVETPRGKGERVGQEPTAPPATGAAWQTPPGARPNRGGRRSAPKGAWTQGHSRPVARVGRGNPAATQGPEEWSHNARKGVDRTRLTGHPAPRFPSTSPRDAVRMPLAGLPSPARACPSTAGGRSQRRATRSTP